MLIISGGKEGIVLGAEVGAEVGCAVGLSVGVALGEADIAAELLAFAGKFTLLHYISFNRVLLL